MLMLCVRSPLATAVVTRAISRTCAVRFEAIELTDSVRSFQVPLMPGSEAWAPSLPSTPTSSATRVSSPLMSLSRSTIPLTVFACRRKSPRSGGSAVSISMRSVRSPMPTALTTRATSSECEVTSSSMSLTPLT